jgi:hypothetical protein
VWLSQSTSLIMFLLAIYKLLTIRPSIITQIDFDELALKARRNLPKFLEKSKEEYDGEMLKVLEMPKVPEILEKDKELK